MAGRRARTVQSMARFVVVGRCTQEMDARSRRGRSIFAWAAGQPTLAKSAWELGEGF